MRKLLIILSVFALFITGCQREEYVANVTELMLVRTNPSSAYAGAIIKILGRNFSTKTPENKVTVGGVEAKVLEATEWDLTIVLPDLPNGEHDIEVETPKGKVGGLKIVIKERPAHVYLASILAGSGKYATVDGSGTAASFSQPEGIIPDGKGEFYILQRGAFAIRKMNTVGMVTTVPISGEALSYPWQGAVLPGTNVLYFANKGNHKLLKMGPDGVVTAVPGFTLNNPMGLKFTPDGTGYLASRDNNSVIKFKNDSGIKTYEIKGPSCVAIDAKGRIIVGTNSGYLQMIDTDETIKNIAGEGKTNGTSGDGGAGDLVGNSTIGNVNGIYAANDGTLYFCDVTSQTVRKLTPDASGDYSKGKLETIASGFYPSDVYVSDDCTKIYVTSATSQTVRLIE